MNKKFFGRLTALVLALAMCLSMAGCGKSEAAAAADQLISDIGTVTLDSEAQIIAAEVAVAALTEEEVKQLDNEEKLNQARADYEKLVEEARVAELKAQAAEIDAAINAIGTVSEESSEAIAAAREQYNSCDSEVQQYITALPALEAAEQQLEDLRVNAVSDLISAIGSVTLDSGDAIKAAQEAYDALSTENQAKVANAGTLTDAAEQLKALKKTEGDKLLSSMILSEDKVRRLSFYYPTNTIFRTGGEWYADVRCFLLPYIGRDGDGNVWLRLIYNYTDDDWIFFKKVTVAADDERYTKSFSYFDIVRDNAYGNVWEYMDDEVSDSDIEMLWDVANSAETIIRFEGDDYTYDFTVTATDKAAIRQVLTAYEAIS